ncbi:hypothetical protein HK405_007012, partial [Cladochytrium tenue]
WVIAHYAALCIGAISVPLNAWLKAAELGHCLADSQPSVVFADPPRLALIATAWPAIAASTPGFRPPLLVTVPDYGGSSSVPASAGGTLLPAGSGLRPMRAFAEFEASGGRGHAALAAVELGPEDDATIFYTSGTTGLPKGALATHRNLVSVPFGVAADNAIRDLRIKRGGGSDAVVDDAPARAVLLSVPLFHVTAAMSLLLPATAAGFHIAMMRKWDPLEALRLIEKERISNFIGVPAMLWQILDSPEPSLTNGYGLTETCGGCIKIYGQDYALKPDSIGPPNGATEVMIVEPGTVRPLPVGEIGELAIKGPTVVKGYWNNDAATRKAIRDGWLLTGDVARVDADGFVYVLDRMKDMVIRGGENVYCVEVESVLFAHPAVADCAVLGLPDRVMGERVAAVVVLAEGASVTPEELRAYCAARLAHFKVPEVVVVRTAPPLPRNAAGKVLKRELREEILAAADPAVKARL